MTFVSLGLITGTVETLVVNEPITVHMPFADCRPSCVRTRHEIAMYRGDVLAQPVQVLQDGAPFPLTGAVLTFTVRRIDTSPVLIQNHPVITNAAEGRFTITLAPEDTEGLEGNIKYQYDVEYRAGETVRTLVKDRLLLKPDITY